MAYNSFPQTSAAAINAQPAPSMGLAMMPQQQQFENQQLITSQGMQGQVIQQQMQQIQQQYQQQMRHMQQLMHPGMNDQPLEFNINKNKPPVTVINEEPTNGSELLRSDDADRRDKDQRRGNRERDRRDRRERSDNKRISSRESEPTEKEQTTLTNQPPATAMTAPMMMGMNTMMGSMMGGMMTPGMMPMIGGMDASMMGMSQYGMMPGMMPDGTMMPTDGAMGAMMTGDTTVYQGQRPVLEFKECSLVPPSPMAPPPVTRERPLGCRTVYVGGLPDNCTEDIIRDVFGRCGEMLTVRLSKKNFCHIRFLHESSVDAAMLYSGYRMRIGNNTDAPNTGKLHVDYAQARVDQYEYECRQRALQREARHRERLERDRMRPMSPPPIPHYTDHEAGTIADQIKTDEGFKKSVQTVIAWLERGDLSKRNANTFYSMIQSTHSHVRRLLNEKLQSEEELQTAKDHHRSQMQNIVAQFEFIEKVFTSASHKKCWDHFTKAQRKNIETWRKQSLEIKQIQIADGLTEEAEEEMDVSDEENDSGPQKKRVRNEVSCLKEENDSLRCQLEAYKNEVDLVKADLKSDVQSKERQIKVLQQTIQTMRAELTTQKEKLRMEEGVVKKLKAKMKVHEDADIEDLDNEIEDRRSIKEDKDEEPGPTSNIPPSVLNNDKDARLVGLISTFLHVHPFGASVDYVWSFLAKMEPSLRPNEVEALMSRFPGVFRQELSGIGAGMERRWIFCGFESVV